MKFESKYKIFHSRKKASENWKDRLRNGTILSWGSSNLPTRARDMEWRQYTHTRYADEAYCSGLHPVWRPAYWFIWEVVIFKSSACAYIQFMTTRVLSLLSSLFPVQAMCIAVNMNYRVIHKGTDCVPTCNQSVILIWLRWQFDYKSERNSCLYVLHGNSCSRQCTWLALILPWI